MVSIKLIGIGGGGCNSLDRWDVSGIADVDGIVMDFFHDRLESSKVPEKILLDATWRGLDSPGKEYRKNDVLMQKSRILQAIGAAEAVIVMAGLGGATGSGGTPAIIEIAKEQNVYAAAVVCTPYNFEGIHRKQEAVEAVKSISEKADIMTVISGDSVLQNADKKLGVDGAFELLDKTMVYHARNILEFVFKVNPPVSDAGV